MNTALTLERKPFALKSRISAIIMTVLLFVGFASANMRQVEATGAIGDMQVTVGDDGSLSIGGTSGITTSSSSGAAWTEFIRKYRNFIVGFSGLGSVAMVMFFIFNLLKLGATSGNPSERTKALTGLVWSGVAAAGLGSVTVIVGFFYSALK